MASYIRTGDHLTIVFDDGVSATVYASTPQFKDVRDALNARDYERARELALPAEQVTRQVQDNFGEGPDAVTVEYGIVRYHGKELHGTLADRMVQMLSEGFNIAPLKLFLINLHQNPSYRAVNELYSFLERGNLPITDDGHFLAYKKVRADYKDVHSGTFDNSVGQVCEMPRNEVDENSRNECSNGLHFCSRNYLNNFGGERIMIVKINPRDVVAIPADYNMSKGRTCRYEVINELEPEGKLEGSYRDTRSPEQIEQDLRDSGWSQTSDGGWVPWDGEDQDDEDDDWDGDDCGNPNCDVCNPDDEDEDDEIPAEVSSFAGLPGDDTVTVPRDVAIDIAKSLDEPYADPVGTTFAEVIGVTHNPNRVMSFATVKEAAEYADITPSAIRRVLRGERKTAGGWEWRPGNVDWTETFTGV